MLKPMPLGQLPEEPSETTDEEPIIKDDAPLDGLSGIEVETRIEFDTSGNIKDCMELLINRAYEITVGFYRVSYLRANENVAPVIINDMYYYPVIDARFPTFSSLEAYIRSTYVNELAEEFLNNPKLTDIDGRLHTVCGMMGSGLRHGDHTIEMLVEEEDYAEIRLTIPTMWDDGPPNISIMKFVRENGRWLISQQGFGS